MFAEVKHVGHRTENGAVVGYAAPADGHQPAAVGLYGGETLVHLAQASRYSGQASHLGRRFGWCGFFIPSAGRALALSSHVTIRCFVSGRELGRIGSRRLLSAAQERESFLTVFDLLRHAREETSAREISEILPFAKEHHARNGLSVFIEASYQMLLRRSADPEAMIFWSKLDCDDIVTTLLATLIGSDEYRDSANRYIPGPFDQNFRFTLTPFK